MLALSLQISLNNETLFFNLLLNVSLPFKKIIFIIINFEHKDTVYCLSSNKFISAFLPFRTSELLHTL